MPGPEFEFQVTASVLDRLLDTEPDVPRDPTVSRQESIRRLRRSVQRDLENLLNSRNTFGEIPEGFSELTRSLVIYGLPDFSSFNLGSTVDRTRLTGSLEKVIERFEPRLVDVKVELLTDNKVDRSLAFRIEANLLLHPAVERVAFDAVMQLHNQAYSVQETE